MAQPIKPVMIRSSPSCTRKRNCYNQIISTKLIIIIILHFLVRG